MELTDLLEVKEKVKRIKWLAEGKGDDEAAHGQEDDLYQDFVKMVAEIPTGSHGAVLLVLSKIAKEVLKTQDIDFARWCA